MRHRIPSALKPALWRRCIGFGLLALLLLFAQQQATLHWLSHAIEATQGDAKQAPPPNHACDECTALAALGGAMPAPAVAPLPALAAEHQRPIAFQALESPSPLRLGYRSRAPPPLS